MIATAELSDAVHAAVAGVDDPEMPGVSIVELGLLETLHVGADGQVRVGLIPTFSGCPALATIAADVRAAVSRVDGVSAVEVAFLATPVWSVDRISAAAEARLGAGLGIAVERSGAARCPRCGAPTDERSMFGPTRCRAVHGCPSCGEVVEVMR
ncbi:iron-sulfur cluster assembly protein [Conyzicola sp.]|uniref:iron-sulfur cluster assembly protein n=1 Tax=Conyzicola sp. TaxID=1969404 RepID=UPI00398A2633